MFKITPWLKSNCSCCIEQPTMESGLDHWKTLQIWWILPHNYNWPMQLKVSYNFYSKFTCWKITFHSLAFIVFFQVQMAPPIKGVIKLIINFWWKVMPSGRHFFQMAPSMKAVIKLKTSFLMKNIITRKIFVSNGTPY